MEMLSLYDYLGKPAGPDLGKQVASAAATEKIRIDAKYVTNLKYSGDILMYPKEWLDKYFKTEQTDDLPF